MSEIGTDRIEGYNFGVNEIPDGFRIAGSADSTTDETATFVLRLYLIDGRDVNKVKETSFELSPGETESFDYNFNWKNVVLEPSNTYDVKVQLDGQYTGLDTVTTIGQLTTPTKQEYAELSDMASDNYIITGISPENPAPGDTVTVSIKIEDANGSGGFNEAEVYVNGEKIFFEYPQVSAGGQWSDTATFTPDSEGEYTIEFSGGSASTTETVTVSDGATSEPTPSYQVDIDSMDPKVAAPEEIVRVEYTIQNVGDGDGSPSADLKIDGTQAGSNSHDIPAGGSTSGVFEFNIGFTGEFSVAVVAGGNSSQRFLSVEEPDDPDGPVEGTPDVNVSIRSFEPTQPEVGQTVTVEYRAYNGGDGSADGNFTLSVNGSQIDSESLVLDPQQREINQASFSPDSAGSYTVVAEYAGDSSSSSIEVVDPGTGTQAAVFEPRITNVVPTSPVAGDIVKVDYRIDNTGTGDGEAAVNFLVNGSVIASNFKFVTAGSSNGGTFEFEVNSTGGVDIGVKTADGTATESIMVEEQNTDDGNDTDDGSDTGGDDSGGTGVDSGAFLTKTNAALLGLGAGAAVLLSGRNSRGN